MAHRYSTADFNAFLTNMKTAYADGILKAYSGSQPSSPDAAVTGTFLGNVTLAGATFTPGSPTGGLEWAAPVLNVMDKAAAEEWKFTCSTPGTIGYLRFVCNATDAGGVSTTLRRMDFSVTLTGGGGDITMTKITFTTAGETGVIQALPITLSNIL